MAVPAHDERDFEFAEKFGIEIRPVIRPDDGIDDVSVSFTGQILPLHRSAG